MDVRGGEDNAARRETGHHREHRNEAAYARPRFREKNDEGRGEQRQEQDIPGQHTRHGSEFQRADVFHVDRLPGTIQGDDDGKADRDFSGGYGDDEEDENLGVVVGQSRDQMEAGKGNERKVGGVQHQLERHKNDYDVAPEQNAGEPNREKHPADNQIMAKCYHVMKMTKHEYRMSKE
jgi:hypothetical protein